MMSVDFPCGQHCLREMAVIGEIVAAYRDVEFDLTVAVAAVHCIELAVQTMFRLRAEDARLEIADAMARDAYYKAELGISWAEVFGNIEFCLAVKNQYARGNWFWSPEIGLGLVDLSSPIGSNEKPAPLTVYPVDLVLLQEQKAYFAYVQESLKYLSNAYTKKAGRSSFYDYSQPGRIKRPIRHPPEVVRLS